MWGEIMEIEEGNEGGGGAIIHSGAEGGGVPK